MEVKLQILAEQYASVSMCDIQECLLSNDGDLDRASADLLTRKLETEARVRSPIKCGS